MIEICFGNCDDLVLLLSSDPEDVPFGVLKLTWQNGAQWIFLSVHMEWLFFVGIVLKNKSPVYTDKTPGC